MGARSLWGSGRPAERGQGSPAHMYCSNLYPMYISSRRSGGRASLCARAAGVSTSLRYSVPWNLEAASCQPSCRSYGVVSSFVRCPRHVTMAPASQPGPLRGGRGCRAPRTGADGSPELPPGGARPRGPRLRAHPSSPPRCSRSQRSRWSRPSRTSSSRGWYRSGYPSRRSKLGPRPAGGGL